MSILESVKNMSMKSLFSWKSKTISVVSSNAMTRTFKYKFFFLSNFQDLNAYMYKNRSWRGHFWDIELYHETMQNEQEQATYLQDVKKS